MLANPRMDGRFGAEDERRRPRSIQRTTFGELADGRGGGLSTVAKRFPKNLT
jgi:hypothetical protein